jgi:acyl-CoA synthetase (NDP forming)
VSESHKALPAEVFTPKRVAIVGDTPGPGRGGLLHEQILRRGFTGQLFPVNPRYPRIRELAAYPSLAAIGAPVDFVAVALGPARALDVMRDAAAAGARAVLFIASGFAEVGGVGARIQAELVELARQHSITLLGPNCYGIANVAGGFAPFFGTLPEPLRTGGVALIFQSGALTHGVGDALAARGVGFAHVITVGNEAAVGVADYVEALAFDPKVTVIACYVEGFRDGARFAATVATAQARGKSVVVLPVGRSAQSRAATAAHTGALAGERRVVEAYLRDLGVVAVNDLDEMVEAIELAGYLPTIGAGQVSISTISGGGCGVIADLAEDVGLELSPYPPGVAREIAAALPEFATVANPLDLTGLATDDLSILDGSLRAADAQDGVALHLFAINTPLAATEPERELYRRMAGAVLAAKPDLRAPVGFFTMASGALDPVLVGEAHAAGAPIMQGAREALAAVGRLRASRAGARARPATGEPDGAVDRAMDRAVHLAMARLRAAPGDTLTDASALILAELGLRVAGGALATSPEEAVAAADWIGYPVVLKVSSPQIVHKSEHGGVILDVRGAEEVRDGFQAIVRRAAGIPDVTVHGVRVEEQIRDGVQAIIGVTVDPTLGPAVVVGAGGIYAELLDDTAVALAPVDEAQARTLIGRTRLGRLLAGLRGQPPADIGALAAAVAAVSRLAWAARHEISAVDLNPIIVHAEGDGATVVDAVIIRTGPNSYVSR